MSSVVKICNAALIELGATTINSINENNANAARCNALWDITRRELLRLHPWNFAIQRVQLAKMIDPPSYRYKYQYQLPSDCIRVLAVVNQSGTPIDDYKSESNRIVTDSDKIFLKYITDVESVPSWDSSFVEVMVASLANKLAYAIPGKTSHVEITYKQLQMKLIAAQSIDASESPVDTFGELDNNLLGVRQ